MKPNTRPLDTIADNIHRLERRNIFDIGDLLIEAKSQCEHGEWLDWLSDEFDWSVDTAENYMRVAEMGAKFRNIRNLKLGKTTLYALAGEAEEHLHSIVDELAKHATQARLKSCDAERVIDIGIGRHMAGDLPDAALAKLARLDDSAPWYQKAVSALREHNPETDEHASEIVTAISMEYYLGTPQVADDERSCDPEARRRAQDEAEREAESILAGDPPVLPASVAPPEPKKLGPASLWAGTETFDRAVRDLLDLSTKPAARFVGVFPPADLQKVSDFLLAVTVADKAKAKPDISPTVAPAVDDQGIPAFLLQQAT
jgi:hypothetical protein